MISAQTLRVCREGKPVPTFPDHALTAKCLVLDADADPARPDQFAEPHYVVLRPPLHGDEQHLALEAYPPAEIADMIAELDGIADRARLQAKPTLAGRAHYHGAVIVE